MYSATRSDSGRDVFLIREAVVGGERGGGAGQVHLSQAASLPVLLPPPRERSTAVTGKLHCPEKRGSHSSPPSSIPPALHLVAPTPLQEDETNQQAQPLCSQPARLQFQTSLDHFSCSPEMNNAHINWCQLINFRLTALYFFNKGLAASFCFAKQPQKAPAANYSSPPFNPQPESLSLTYEMINS